MTVQYPYILICGGLILLVWWLFLREKIGFPYMNPLLKKYARIPIRLFIIWCIRGCMILLTFLIIAIPSIRVLQNQISGTSGKDIIIILDISKSMLADDIRPSRLSEAKDLIESFLTHPSIDQYGLIIFAGKPFLLSPLTEDHRALSEIITSVTTDTIRQNLPGLSGTNIGDALLMASTLSQSGRNLDVILLTDGRANIGINPITATKEIASKNIRVFPISIGASSGTILSYVNSEGQREYFYDEKGEKIRADIDVPMMQQIAQATDGQYFHAEDGLVFERVFDILHQKIATPIFQEEKYISQSIVLPCVFFLCILSIIHTILVFQMRKI